MACLKKEWILNMFIKLNIDCKAFGDKVIFDDTHIEIEKHDFIIIYGESGIGKSTLLKMIGLISNFDGDYFINDKLVNKKDREKTRIKTFSYLFQEPLLIPYLKVRENIVLPLKNLKKNINEREINEIAKRLKIYDLLDCKVDNLSGGEAIRVSIARAIAADRPVLVVDEPTGNLDSENALSVMQILKEENEKGKTIIMVSHSKEFEKYFNKIIRIENKKIVC